MRVGAHLERLRAYIVASCVGLVMVAALWGAIAAIVVHNRDDLRAAAKVDAGNVARVFATHVRRSVTLIDLALSDYARFHREDPDASWSKGLPTAYLSEGGVFQWAMIDADGMLAYSNLAPITRSVDLSDRAHFRVHRDLTRGEDAADAIFISEPVLGRVSSRWSIQFTRRLTTQTGAFAGVVVFSVGPEYFIDGFEAIDVGANSVTLLAGMDRIVRARYRRTDSETTGLGEPLGDAYAFFDPAAPFGTMDAPAVGGGGTSHTAWRRVRGYPLLIAVQIADADVLAESAGVEARLYLVGALVTGVLLVGAVFSGHLFDRRLRAQRQVELQAVELRSANEEIERLAHVSAHHLQEPLRAIASYTQLVTTSYGGALPDEGREWLREVVDAATRMKQLLRDMQFYLAEKSLPRSGRAIDPTLVVDGVAGRVRAAVEGAGGSLTVAPLPRVIADQRRLTEALGVLISNAEQYRSPDRPPIIRIFGERIGDECVIAVADNGIGIDGAYLERIFEVFSRLHRREEYPGTGMGLAIARKMVERLGGRLTVTSTVGEGSVFRVHLPAAEPAEADGSAGRA